MIDTFKKEILECRNPIITTHKGPDGDAVGSSVAWYHFLKKLDKKPILILPDAPSSFLMPFLKNVEYVVFDSENAINTADSNLLFCLDYNAANRVGSKMEQFVGSFPSKRIMIDHHPNPEAFCDITISRTNICSTAQLIYQVIDEMDLLELLDVEIGKGIYLGIMTDTGSFRFPSVDKNTHLILAHLLEIGVKHHEIHEAIYDVNTIDRIQLRGYAIAEKLELHPDYPLGIISLSKEELDRFHFQKGDTEGLVNVILSIEGISVAAFFKEENEGVKISFRSKGNYYVNEFAAKYFSGGGHKYAAGGQTSSDLNVTMNQFRSLVGELFQ
ncbi:MAG: bifunctional oligoribonuclease/PAP phosphatase NrnA [Bacteroidetes bacterium]|nr:bifunctional oligoribonuclease/PAP phosphatase NrnA [Bacteroidota bacterium]